jgi:DNA invertase Pin-like site-specific DNA recombinase
MPVMPHARRGNDDRRRPLNILGGLAEFERTLIRARTSEGRERAKPRGVRFGRPKKLCAHQRWEALDRINAGEAVAEVARASGSTARPCIVCIDAGVAGRGPFAC